MSEVGWNGRSAGEDVDAWLTRLTGRIGAAIQAAVQAAHKARKKAAFLAFGRGCRATELIIHGDYCSAMLLRNLAAQHLARFDKGPFRASPLLHQKAGLWRLAPRADKEGTARILTHLKKRTRAIARILARRQRADGLDSFALLEVADRVRGGEPCPSGDIWAAL